MTRWQRHARLGVGVFGIAFAIIVYAAIGDRQTASPLQRLDRFDPRAVLESAGAAFQQFREAKQEFVIEAERQLTYEDDTTKFIGITIKVRNRGGRDFVVSGREGQVGQNEEELDIVGDVRLAASDGFTVNAERATFSKADSTVRVPGPVSFHKGGMSGSGSRMTYNEGSDVLSLAENARVAVADEAGRIHTQFTSGSATLARRDKYLSLEGNVHTIRDDQVLDADRGIARLSDDEERVTFIELRGNARVAGGGAFDSMSARDIDLDYTDDGETLERVALRGNAGVVMKGEEDGAAGRQFGGESLDLVFAADSSLVGAVGREAVRVEMPGAKGAQSRSIRARTFDASGEPGKGLTVVQFNDDVEYREAGTAGKPARTARSAALRLALADDEVANAVFTGGANFEEEGFRASAAQADYDPGKGTLSLTGPGGAPRVTNPSIEIEASSIAVTLEGLRMVASGNVKTVLRQQTGTPSKPGASGGPANAEGRLPSLLQQSEPVNVNASALDYHDAAGKAVYTGGATLWQGQTAVRGDVLTLDRTRGDFTASGAARSNIVLDTGASVGRASEIHYDDAARRISYGTGDAPPPTAAPASALPPAQVSGPQGDLRAKRIDLLLSRTASHLETLEAYTEVNVRLDKRVATGDRLTYNAEAERYVMTGIATVPVRIIEECRETTGRTVTFFKSADRIIVDGNEEVRTQSSRSGPCTQPTTP